MGVPDVILEEHQGIQSFLNPDRVSCRSGVPSHKSATMVEKREHQNMTWTRVQEEYKPLGRNKLVKRSVGVVTDVPVAPYRKIGKHKLVLNPPTTVGPAVFREETVAAAKHPRPAPPKAARSDRPVKNSKAIVTSGTSQSSTVLPRKLGRNKLVFNNSKTSNRSTTTTTTAIPPVAVVPAELSVTRVIPPQPPQRGRSNQLVFSKKETKDESSSSTATVPVQPVDPATAAANLKHLRANYKSTKSGLKRVEPPVCKFFQQRGMCFDDNCPYRHVKVGRHGAKK